ncbi:aldo/keto reductase [Paenibacillus nasutitermitis]|uniref:Oxidoreductase n=1 Tax=Paenibacillus nasutitermitis TaxID=1652958 RepID=A0A916Z8M3_9BACL|nr:aldo/keto reductase [Paenibacillus nasutitermitis]GGD79922.1 oxidoreductase [Paenibacillus nasutitermitis]
MQLKRHVLPGTDLKVSSFCYGVMKFGSVVKGSEMLELYRQYCAAEGNFFDTAHSYACWIKDGDGASERGLGECLRKFGNRSDVVILTKGGHPRQGDIYIRPDDCMTMEVISADITESLDRLQIDSIDIYMLHRDDILHPVSEIIEMLNEEIRRGRIRYIGASNWSTERLRAANTYAAEKGLQGFVVSSPQWNLAQPNHSPIGWDGEYDATALMMKDEDLAWHKVSKFPVMPWTPSAYGYLAGSMSSNALSFDNSVSQERRVRARQLASELRCTPNQIALAFLLAHDFPVFPILGTMNLEHLNESLGADQISLTAEQREWLLSG